MTNLLFVDYGFEIYRTRFLEELSHLDFKIECISQKETKIISQSIHFKQIGSVNYQSRFRWFQEILRSPLLFREIMKFKPSILIVGNIGINAFLCIMYSFLFDVPVIVWARLSIWTEKDRSFLNTIFRKFILSLSRAVIVNSQSGFHYIDSITKTPIQIIPQASNIELRRRPQKIALQSVKSERVFCYVGRLVEGKGLDRVIEILARSGFKGTIRVAGTGPLLNRLRSIRLPDELKVDFLGWCNTNQVEEIINQSDALIFPSECDEWGLAVVEAINLGRPVLGSIRAGAVEELLVNHRHGYLFDPFDPEAIKGAFDKFSELSDEEISELSSNCLKLSAERKLSAKNMAMLFDEIIRKSLN